MSSSQTAGAQQDSTPAASKGAHGWLVRGLPGYSSKTRIEFAKAGKPMWLKIAADEISLSALINAVCGEQDNATSDFLVAEALRINALDTPQEKLRTGEVAAIPFCFRVDSAVDVAVNAGENPSSILTERAGIAGTVTLRNTYRLNKNRYRSYEDFARRLQPGTTITVSYAAPERVFVPKQDGVQPLAIVRQYESSEVQQMAVETTSLVTGEDGSRPPPPPLSSAIASLTTGELHLVSALNMTPQEEAKGCGNPPVGDFSPFDSAVLKKAYELSAEARRMRYPSASAEAHVGIVDTGLAGLGSVFFAEKYFLRNELEHEPRGTGGQDDDQQGLMADFKDDVYGANLDRGGDIAPYPDPNYPKISHGTQMAALVLGGKDVVNDWFSTVDKPPIRVKVFKFTRPPRSPETTKMAEADSLATAIAYLAETRVKVVNMSLATESRAGTIKRLLEGRSDILFVVAAGNGRPNQPPVGVDLGLVDTILPAALGGYRRVPNVLTVAAHGYDGDRAKFSNYSAKNVNFLAPGCGLQAPDIHGTFGKVNGSSAAAAVTTFGAALVRSLGPQDMSPAKVRDRLIVSTDYDRALAAHAVMPGRLNLVKSVSLYRDVLELSGANEAYTYGKIDNRRYFLTACQNFTSQLESTITNPEILKIVPNLKGPDGQLEMHFWLQRDDVQEMTCVQNQNSGSWSLGSIEVNGTATDMPLLRDIKEIVFSTY